MTAIKWGDSTPDVQVFWHIFRLRLYHSVVFQLPADPIYFVLAYENRHYLDPLGLQLVLRR